MVLSEERDVFGILQRTLGLIDLPGFAFCDHRKRSAALFV